MEKKLLSIEEAIESMKGNPGLVLGPLATTSSKTYKLIVESVLQECGIDISELSNVPKFLENIKSLSPEKYEDVRRKLISEYEKVTPISDVDFIAEANWSICISLTNDLLFESHVQNFLDSQSNSRTVTIIDHPSKNVQSRTLPIYKLFGSLGSSVDGHKVAFSESEIFLRKNVWAQLLSNCSDYLKGGPLLFFGTESMIEYVKELLSIISVMKPPAPNSLFFLKGDPLLSDSTIKSLCSSFSNVKVIDANIREFAKELNKRPQKQLELTFSKDDQEKIPSLLKYENIISIPPSEVLPDSVFTAHRVALIDSLFRPTIIDWQPYMCDLELRRDYADDLLTMINNEFVDVVQKARRFILVRGDAGVGKTMFIKRGAIDLARRGDLVLWCKRTPYENWLKTYRELSADLSALYKKNKEDNNKFIIIVDDAWSLKLDAAELVSCFSSCEAPICFVFAARNTDYFNQNNNVSIVPSMSLNEIELQSQLTDNEMDNLREMLLKIGAAQSMEEAVRLIENIPTKNATDILCSLWYLVPETRSNLSESLKDEYYRLGSSAASIEDFAQKAQLSGEAARHAYEFVSVTSKYNIGLPLEVLVRALEISYEEFIDMAIDGKPLWGLLYDEEDVENQTVLYRTRNEIVTKVLLELVNGGVGHAGEYRILKDLLSSCDVGSQIHRNFAIEVLVRSSNELSKSISYKQGLELFEAAENSLPHEDRLLAHHKGKWMHKVGKEFQKAYGQFQIALQVQQYPGQMRPSRTEHIHTSMAASVVGLVRDGKQDPASGLAQVKEHIQQATNPKIFHAHTGHVSANLLFEMAQQQLNGQVEISISSYSNALQEVEKTLQSIGPTWKKNHKHDKSIEMLKELEKKILEAVPSDDELEELSIKLFEEKKSQIGFELICRKKLFHAQNTDKGSAYNQVKKIIEKYTEIIIEGGGTPSSELLATKIDLIIRWRLQRPKGPVDWEIFIEDLQALFEDLRYRDDPIKNFYFAVALYHMGEIEKANGVFSNLRRMNAFGLTPAEVRCFYINEQGFPKRLQCNISESHGRVYAEIMELETDVLVLGPRGRMIQHTYIGFSINGPVGIYQKPDENQMLLA